MKVRRGMAALAVGVLALVGVTGCSDSGGGGDSIEGVYVHPEEGTITLAGGGKATWEQEGNDEPAEFDWSADGETVTFEAGGKKAKARIKDADLVLPPNMISGDEDVTFTKQ